MGRRPGLEQITPEHERFCQFVAGGMNAIKAYQNCGMDGKINQANIGHYAYKLKKRLSWRIEEILGYTAQPLQQTSKVVAQANEAFRRDALRARDLLWKIIEDPKTQPSVKVRALSEILDRGLGKPVETTETNLNVRYVITSLTMSKDQWIANYCKPVDGTGTGTVN